MPSCLKCGTALAVNEEGVAPVLCDRCAGVATGRARRSMAIGGLGRYPVTTALMAINIVAYVGQVVSGQALTYWGVNAGPLTLSGEYWRLLPRAFYMAASFILLSICGVSGVWGGSLNDYSENGRPLPSICSPVLAERC